MKKLLYPKLAFESIRKNKRLYLPYILTCVGMVAMYYIILYLVYCKPVESLPGSGMIREMMGLGSWVMALFSCLFLFYTNSFLMRRRKKEFGLYSILGMSKRNLAQIQFWETLIIGAAALAGGLFVGILLSKTAELILVNIVSGEIEYSMSFSPEAVIKTVYIFGVIFLLLLLNSVRQIMFSTTMTLLKSENTGEKPPKANWLFGIAGVALLGAAYYIAVTTNNAITAIFTFFGAVMMVILGTYLLMIFGSVMFCRILQKSRRYYYKPNHFVSVSSMAYRMKRNGAGLASICILATMVLVMISSTSSLYFGNTDALRRSDPREVAVTYYMDSFEGLEGLSPENISKLRSALDSYHSEHGVVPQNVIAYREIYVPGYLKDGVVETDVSIFNTSDVALIDDGLTCFVFVPLEDYNQTYGTDYTLSDGEALAYNVHTNFNGDSISFNMGQTLKIVGQIKKFDPDSEAVTQIFPSVFLFVPDLKSAVAGLDRLANYQGDPMLDYMWNYCFDTGLSPDDQITYGRSFLQDSFDIKDNGFLVSSRSARIAEYDRRDFTALYGGLFFLGIMLSVVFIFAAVLIIYYKQISEGYEDQSRFGIMQKVGMTKREIRKSINSQLLTVFFLPLVLAAVHLGFALPIISKLLLLFDLRNIPLFYAVAAGCFAIFALLYTLVYKITSNAYYNIVSGAKEA